MILGGGMTIGDFFMFTMYLGFMIAPVMQTVGVTSQMTEAFAGLDRMHEVLAEQPEDIDPKRVVRLERIRGLIQFDNAFYEYEAGKPVLARNYAQFRSRHGKRLWSDRPVLEKAR
jgi:subfamily B ATP-binding cassette protein MsbA